MNNYSNQQLLTELETRLATNLFTPSEIRTLSRILAANYTQIAQTLTYALQAEKLNQQSLLSQLSPEERQQVTEYLAKHGFKKKVNQF